MLVAQKLERIFVFREQGQEIELSDPNIKWSAESVMNFYANTYPILTTAKVSAPKIENDKVVYRFESIMGTKG